jgi:hypothetical protein
MVTKKQTPSDKAGKKGRVKVEKLKLDKETVREVKGDEARGVKGGGATSLCNIGGGFAQDGATSVCGSGGVGAR